MKILKVESNYDAQVLVYRVESEYDADVLVYRIDSVYDAEKAPELWYFTDDPYDEKALKIYYTDSVYGKLFLLFDYY